MPVLDAYGRPYPKTLGYAAIQNADGSIPQLRNKLSLDASIVATDDPATEATKLSVTHETGVLLAVNNLSDLADETAARGNLGLGSAATHAAGDFLPGPNSGTTAGRANVPLLIDAHALNASSYSTPAWAAGLYKYLKWIVRVDLGAFGQSVFTLSGIGGSYTNHVFGGAGATAISVDTTSGWNLNAATPTPNNAIVEMWIKKGGGRFGFSQCARVAATNGVQLYSSFYNDDTTSDVTGATLTVTGVSVTPTGYIEVWGVPA
jgi:hypothetical protein